MVDTYFVFINYPTNLLDKYFKNKYLFSEIFFLFFFAARLEQSWAMLPVGPGDQDGAWAWLLLRPAGRAKVSFFCAVFCLLCCGLLSVLAGCFCSLFLWFWCLICLIVWLCFLLGKGWGFCFFGLCLARWANDCYHRAIRCNPHCWLWEWREI